MIRILFSQTGNDVFGINGDLPFKLKKDLEFFKSVTTNNLVVMGRKTYDSLPKNLRPLPNRKNIIITTSATINKTESYLPSNNNTLYFRGIDSALDYCRSIKHKNTYIVGGKRIIEESIDYADEIFRTMIYNSCHYKKDDLIIKAPDINYKDFDITRSKLMYEIQEDKTVLFVYEKFVHKNRHVELF